MAEVPVDDSGYTFWDYFFPLLVIFAVSWYCLFWGISLLGWAAARSTYTRRPRSPLSSSPRELCPGVSIIRPLKGLDPNMYENLESSFTQDYSNYEIIFAVKDPQDRALRVVHDLIAKHPQIPTQVIIGEEVVGVNPKVNNLIKPFRQARHDILWVLDSNVQVAPGTLARSVDALIRSFPHPDSEAPEFRTRFRRRIGLVHHVPFATTSAASGARSLGSRVEQAFLNTTHAKMYIAINRLAVDSCVMGKSNMYRRSDIEHLTALPLSRNKYKTQPLNDNAEPELPVYPPDIKTGLAAFGEFLAEDNMIASSVMHELGLLHDTSCDVAINALSPNMSLADYIQRRIRWIRVRKHMVLAATLIEPLTECFALGALGGWAFHVVMPDLPLGIFALLHIAGWLAVDLGVYKALAGHSLAQEGTTEYWSFIGAWLVREVLAFPIWFLAVLGSDVTWRGEIYTVLRNGKVKKSERKATRRGDYEILPVSAEA